MAFYNYSESLTRAFVTLDKDPEQNKVAMQKVEVFLNGIKMVDRKLIACRAIISQNYTIYFTGACSHLLAHVTQLHGGAKVDAQRYI